LAPAWLRKIPHLWTVSRDVNACTSRWVKACSDYYFSRLAFPTLYFNVLIIWINRLSTAPIQSILMGCEQHQLWQSYSWSHSCWYENGLELSTNNFGLHSATRLIYFSVLLPKYSFIVDLHHNSGGFYLDQVVRQKCLQTVWT